MISQPSFSQKTLKKKFPNPHFSREYRGKLAKIDVSRSQFGPQNPDSSVTSHGDHYRYQWEVYKQKINKGLFPQFFDAYIYLKMYIFGTSWSTIGLSPCKKKGKGAPKIFFGGIFRKIRPNYSIHAKINLFKRNLNFAPPHHFQHSATPRFAMDNAFELNYFLC